ncbi:MAG: selenocysteine-specific translation elongation factor [Dissulfuribacterales bacterium]
MTAKTVVLGTAGHIDHGKTSLIRALTGIDTDRLKEEKSRGITIELGFAHLDLPSGQRIGIVDVPGHERFVKHMVAGATGMDMVLLVIAADEGIMPQTSEHMAICELLSVKKGLIALTKKDMVEPDWLELVREDIALAMQGTFLEGAEIIPVSSVTRDGLDDLKAAIQRVVNDLPVSMTSGPYRLPIDRIFTIKGFGTVVTGTTVSGHIRVGDDAMIYPKCIPTRIRGIQNHGQEAQEAVPGLRTAINLQGVQVEQIERGDVLSVPGGLRPSLLLDIQLYYLASAERPLKHRAPVKFHTGTGEIIGRMLLQQDELAPGERTYAQIKLERPVAVLPGDRYIIRSYSPVITIGGGAILNPLPRRRKRSRPEMWNEMAVLDRGSAGERIIYHLKQADQRGLSLSELSLRTALYGKTLERELERILGQGQALKLDSEGQRILSAEVYEKKRRQALELLRQYHAEFPLSPGISKEELRSRLFPILEDNHFFQRLLANLVKTNELVQDKDLIRLANHQLNMQKKDKDIQLFIADIYLKAGMTPPSKTELFSMFNDKALVSSLLNLLVREGVLVYLKDDLYLHSAILEQIRSLVINFLKQHGEMGINDFRDLTGGLSRKYMVPILEYLDNQKLTMRIGDKRRLRG